MSNRYAWTTDVHVGHLENEGKSLKQFAESLVASDPTGVFITGDVSISKQLVYHLSTIERVVRRPVYFVLGNHDYYGSEVEKVRKQMRELVNVSSYLRYMSSMPFMALTQNTAVVGHDGWYDCGYGNVARSTFFMSDWIAIGDFARFSGGREYMMRNSAPKNKNEIIAVAKGFAKEAVQHVHDGIKGAARNFKHIIILTHVPPFRESHIYKGAPADEGSLPWYTSQMMGELLLQAAKSYPNVNFTVLCGHTHEAYVGQHAPNLWCRVGHSEYGTPIVCDLVEVP